MRFDDSSRSLRPSEFRRRARCDRHGSAIAEWGVVQWWRGFVSRELARVRRDGRASVLWSLRITVAATASYLVASLFFPGTQPLLAPLTAMLVVQVTPLSLLASGLDRVIAVVAGVALAVGFAAVVPLEWWSLGVLILISITIGQFLRLRSNLVEVAISAMLVLGVGAIGAEAAAWQRIAETLVGAAVGIIATLVFPPKVASSDAGRAIDGLADAVSELLARAAGELDAMAEGEPQRLSGAAREWLDDARRITHEHPGRRCRAAPGGGRAASQRACRSYAARRARPAAGPGGTRAHGGGDPRPDALGGRRLRRRLAGRGLRERRAPRPGRDLPHAGGRHRRLRRAGPPRGRRPGQPEPR